MMQNYKIFFVFANFETKNSMQTQFLAKTRLKTRLKIIIFRYIAYKIC